LLEVGPITERILSLHRDEPIPTVPGYETFSYALQDHQRQETR
jgi:hypothetical protein